MSLVERVARLFMFPVRGTALSAADAAWLERLRPGGVILVAHNFGSPEETRALVRAIHATNPALPPLVALDQEGGIVSRIADDPAPDAPTLGGIETAEISELARRRAEVLAGYGFDVNFAPVADVAFPPASFMEGRAFGSTPTGVAEDVVAYLQGVEGTGVLHCVKHFPGHGRVTIDSHEALPMLSVEEDEWWQAEALPFQAAIDSGVPMVMLGHLVMSAWDSLPATLSPVAVRVLREGMGFGGVIVTDDLAMGALTGWGPYDIVDLAIDAGVDLLLYVALSDSPAALIEHMVERVRSGELPVGTVNARVERLLAMQLGRTVRMARSSAAANSSEAAYVRGAIFVP